MRARRILGLLVAVLVAGLLPVAGAEPAVADPSDPMEVLSLRVVDDAGALGREPSVSSDGRFVVFVSSQAEDPGGPATGVDQIWLRDRQEGETHLVSAAATSGPFASHDSAEPDVSDDGSRVVFRSQATNLDASDTSTNWDVYVADMTTSPPTVSLVSSGYPAHESSGGSLAPSISADGNWISFRTSLPQSSADTDGGSDVYLHEVATGTNTLASVPVVGSGESNLSGGRLSRSALSADGSYLVFGGHYSSGCHGNGFVYNRHSGQTSYLEVRGADDEVVGPDMACVTPAISPNGVVAFTTRVPGDDTFAESGMLIIPNPMDPAHHFHWALTCPAGEINIDGESLSVSDTFRVVFQGGSSGLCVGPVGGSSSHVYAIDPAGLMRISVDDLGTTPTGPSTVPIINGDGTYVVFESWNSTLWPSGLGGSNPRAVGTGLPFVVSEEFTRQYGRASWQDHVADPVNAVTGNFVHQRVDLPSPASGGSYGLEFGRSYNSHDASDVGFGPGWSHSLAVSLRQIELFDTSGSAIAPGDSDIELRFADGRRALFVNTATDVWETPDGLGAELVLDSGLFSIEFVDGQVWSFDSEGRWGSADDGNGESFTISWTPSANVAAVLTHSTGRTLTLRDGSGGAGNEDGRIDVVEASDGRKVTYAYETTTESGNDLWWVSEPATTGAPIAELYDTPNTRAWIEVVHDGSVDADRNGTPEEPTAGVTVANTYDAIGRVTHQALPQGSEINFTYHTPVNTTPGQETWSTTATFTAGADVEHITYTYNAAAQVVGLVDPASMGIAREWDRGLLDEFTDRRGATWDDTFDSDRRLESSLLPDPDGGGPASTGTETVTYVGAGDDRVAVRVNAEGEKTSYTYDGAERIPATVNQCKGGAANAACPGGAGTLTTTIDSTDGLVASVTDPDGVSTTYSYGSPCAARQLCQTTVGSGDDAVVTTYSYDSVTGQVASVTEAPGTANEAVTTYVYDDAGRLEETRDPRYDGSTVLGTRMGYDPAGRLQWVSEPNNSGTGVANASVAYTYWPDGQVQNETTLIASGRHTTTRHEYDEAGRLRFVYEDWADGSPPTYGTKTEYVYDDEILGRVAREVRHNDAGPDLVTDFEYDDNGNQTHRIVDPGGLALTWETSYDLRGRVAHETDPGGVVTSYTYDNVGRVLQTAVNSDASPTTNAVGERVTENVYDDYGRLYQVLGESGVQGSSDPERPYRWGVLEQRDYTPGGRLDATYRPPQDVVSFTWPGDPAADGAVLKEFFDYDGAGRQSARTDAEGEIWRTEYDNRGRVLCELDPTDTVAYVSGATIDCPGSTGATRYAYDDASNVVEVFEPSPTGTGEVSSLRTYSPTGQLATETDFDITPDGSTPTRTFGYTMNGWLDHVIDANDTRVDYLYDNVGNRTERRSTLTAGAAPTGCTTTSVATCIRQTWTHDQLGRVIERADAAGRTTTTSYDAAGRIDVVADPSGRSRDHAWTAAGYPLEVVYDDGMSSFDVDYVFNDFGQRTSLDDETGITTSTYDEAGNLITQTLPDTDTIEWVWDLNSQVHKHQTSQTGWLRRVHGRTYNLASTDIWFVSVWVPVASYTYDDAGRETSEALVSGGTRSWDRTNPAGVVENYDQLVSGVDTDVDLTWHPDGRLATEIDNNAQTCTLYGYDAAGQLDTVETADDDCTSNLATDYEYDYDGHGRRTRQLSPAGTEHYGYDSNLTDQLNLIDNDSNLASPETTFTYDDAGRRLTRDETGLEVDYTWDQAGRLERFEQDNGTTPVDFTLSRDGDGTLVELGPSQLTWDPNHDVPQITEADIDGGGTDLTILYGRRRVATSDSDFYAYDHLGSTVRFEDANDDPILDYPLGYEPYGEPIHTNDTPAYFGYRGELQYGTPESPLVHLRNREYDPDTGTFLTTDPVDGIDGTSTVADPYHYTDNDPLNRTDPLGLRPDEGPCSVFSSTGAVIDAGTCESALDLWEKRDRSAHDCKVVGGVTYGSGTCYVPPQSGRQKDFCFPPMSPNESVVSLGPNSQCGVWSVEVGCERFSNTVTDWICQHRVGILKVASYALIPAAIGAGAVTGGAGAGAVLALTSASLQVSAEAFDDSPCKSQRITVTVVLTILGGGVGGAFGEGGLVAGEAITEAGLVGLDQVEFTC